ncbi:MAG: hypothetical protein AAF517_14720 [Planctomycetota bacterium]
MRVRPLVAETRVDPPSGALEISEVTDRDNYQHLSDESPGWGPELSVHWKAYWKASG